VPGGLEAVAGVVAGVIAGVVAGLATPLISRRFGARARGWPYAVGGALLGAALGWRLDWPSLGPWLVVLVAGLPLCAIDLAVHRLPDLIVLPATALAALSAWSPDALAGGAVLATGYAVLAVLPRSGLGFGDVKLAGLLGVALAALGWSPLVLGTVYAFVLGGVAALVLLATRRVDRDTHLPFGPAMLAGALLAALVA
jgi:leader peptidase (prepilin peptidase) / N-methyltransferase